MLYFDSFYAYLAGSLNCHNNKQFKFNSIFIPFYWKWSIVTLSKYLLEGKDKISVFTNFIPYSIGSLFHNVSISGYSLLYIGTSLSNL